MILLKNLGAPTLRVHGKALLIHEVAASKTYSRYSRYVVVFHFVRRMKRAMDTSDFQQLIN